MRELLEKKFFPFVIKPGRYAGGEPGQIVKDPEGRVKYLHVYPDKYEVGQSYVGLQTLYHVVNADDRFLCERAFAVDLDAEELMRRESIPLFSLESSRPARDFDAIGFTLVDEMVATNMLAMIDLAGMALRSADRKDDDPIIMAGGPAVYNPEPLAPFVDLFFIGDGEEGLPQILAILGESHDLSRNEKLKTIVQQVESVYVPGYYDDQARPTESFAPEKIKARLVPELKPEYYPTKPLLPLVDTVHDHLGVEIMRGCPQGCKFCLAGPIYRPVRIRPVDDICRQVETQLDNTGYDAISLLALSATDHPELETIVSRLSGSLKPRRISTSLPSLRPGSVRSSLLKKASAVRKFGLTIAPEAGTERLRLFIRKDFPDQAIYDTARVAYSSGWTSIKLYFMVGLPSETEADLLGIVEIVNRVYQIGREYTRKAAVNVALSPFVPKAHTPFQWDEALPEKQIFEKINFVKRQIRTGAINVRHNSSQTAMIAALIGRGGRNTAPVIETAYRMGCRFDSWGELFDFDKWMKAFAECGIDPHEGMKAIPFSQTLPWGHIAKGVSVDRLKEQRQASSQELRPYVSLLDEQEVAPEQPKAAMEFGRGNKKVVSRSQIAPTKNRVRLRWGKSPRYRYMSHLENLHMMERALRRARLPVMYSQGHNPGMKLSLGPPLPLGFTSEAEFIDVTLESNLQSNMVDDFRAQLPEGIDIIEARIALGKKASLNSMLNRAEYSLPLTAWKNPDKLEAAGAELMSREHLECQRGSIEKRKTVDIRPALFEFTVEEDRLLLILGLGEGGYAKPTEVAGFLQDQLTMPFESLPFHRLAMYRIDDFGNRIEALDL